jgi:hypothetical protein
MKDKQRATTKKNQSKTVQQKSSGAVIKAYREVAEKTFFQFKKTFELLGSYQQHKNA